MEMNDDVLRCEVAVASSSPRKLWSSASGLPMSKKQAKMEEDKVRRKNEQTRIDFGGLGRVDDHHFETQEERKHNSLSDELLSYHKKFGYINFTRLHEMAKQGIIPKLLMQARRPACSACLYAQATRKSWRNKGRAGATQASSPGQLISNPRPSCSGQGQADEVPVHLCHYLC